ncbi:hypothetical protein HK100_003168, partial [Physocladia obscura]
MRRWKGSPKNLTNTQPSSNTNATVQLSTLLAVTSNSLNSNSHSLLPGFVNTAPNPPVSSGHTTVEIKIHVTQVQNFQNFEHQHEYPLLVVVQPYLEDDSQQQIEIHAKSKVPDVLKMISHEFVDVSLRNLKLFRFPTGQFEKRRVLSNVANLQKVLGAVAVPSRDLVFDFAYHIRIMAYYDSENVACEICIKNFELKEVRDEIIDKFESLRGYNFEITFQRASRPVLLKDDEQVKEICLNESQLNIKRNKSDTTPSATTINTATNISSLLKVPHQFISGTKFDVMVSYSWATKVQVDNLCNALKKHFSDITIWLDRTEMKTDIYHGTIEAITKSSAIIVCLSHPYLVCTHLYFISLIYVNFQTSMNCNLEIKHAQDLRKPLIPVHYFSHSDNVNAFKNDPDLSTPFLITAGALYAEFNDFPPNSAEWSDAFETLIKQINAKVPRLAVIGSKKSAIEIWLKPVDFSHELANYKSEYDPETRLVWIIEFLKEWLITNEEIWWLKGGAGTGKSIIAYSIFVNHPTDQFIIGSIFFCKHDDERKRNPNVVIQTMAWDLSVIFPKFREYLKAVMTDDTQATKKGKPSILSKYSTAFSRLILDGLRTVDDPGKVVLLIIDGLDELDSKTRQLFFDVLKQSHGMFPAWIKFFLTGRPERDIASSLNYLNPLELEPTKQNNMDDLRIFISNQLQSMWKTALSQDVHECGELLLANADGLFIYVRNVLVLFAEKKYSLHDAHEQLRNFKSGPDAVYLKILQAVLADKNEIVDTETFLHVFSVILAVCEPLDILSLCEVGNLDITETSILISKVCLHSLPFQLLTTLCQFSSTILKLDNGKVSVVHKTIKDFLTNPDRCESQFFVNLQNSNFILASQCIHILHKHLTETKLVSTAARTADWINFFSSKPQAAIVNPSAPVLQYVLKNWHLHLEYSNLPSSFDLLAHEFGVELMAASIETQNQHLFEQLLNHGASVEGLVKCQYFTSPVLYESAKRGLPIICAALLSAKSPLIDVNCTGFTPPGFPTSGECCQTSLHASVRGNSMETVK